MALRDGARGLSTAMKVTVLITVLALIAIVLALRAVPKAVRPSTSHVVTKVVTVSPHAP